MECEDGRAGACRLRLARRADGVAALPGTAIEIDRRRAAVARRAVRFGTTTSAARWCWCCWPDRTWSPTTRSCATREERIGAVGLAGIVAFCGAWLFAAGVLILGAVSEFSVLSASRRDPHRLTGTSILSQRRTSMPIYSLDGIAPQFDDLATNWIAPGRGPDRARASRPQCRHLVRGGHSRRQ